MIGHTDTRSMPPPQSRRLYVFLGIASIVLLGCIDYVTGEDFAFSLFYAIPVFLVARRCGVRAGGLAAATAVLAWALAIAPAHVYKHTYGLYWNAFVRVGFFSVVVALATTREELQRAKRAATKDFLTGIENRRGFYERASREIERVKRLEGEMTVACLDCDDFKKINDTFGHDEGNALLSTVAKGLLTGLRAADVSARLGGDEFAVLVVDLPHERAVEIVSRVRARLLADMSERGWPVTFSIGALTFKPAEIALERAIQRADELMYQAKAAGKNRIEHQYFELQESAARVE